jgi:Ca-activated chloride channel family protein
MLRIQTILIVLLTVAAGSAAQTAESRQPPVPQPPPQEEGATPVFRTGVADVRVVVQVTEGGQIVKGLTKDDFVVTDEGQPQPVVYFARESEPLDLLLLLDISGSMRKNIEQMSETARDALKFLSPGDRVAIMTFGVRTHLHFDFNDNHAEVARQLRTAVDDQDAVGYGTAINAAVIDAARMLDSDESQARRSILIVTDNLGLNYQTNDPLTIGYLLKADTVLNAIVIGRGIRPGPERPGQYENPDYTPADVFKLADETGGEAVTANRAAAFFPQMVARIRDSYTLAYHVPAGAQPGQFRHISVELTPAARSLHLKAQVRARSGYYVKP